MFGDIGFGWQMNGRERERETKLNHPFIQKDREKLKSMENSAQTVMSLGQCHHHHMNQIYSP